MPMLSPKTAALMSCCFQATLLREQTSEFFQVGAERVRVDKRVADFGQFLGEEIGEFDLAECKEVWINNAILEGDFSRFRALQRNLRTP
jgi:hypothetical protein